MTHASTNPSLRRLILLILTLAALGAGCDRAQPEASATNAAAAAGAATNAAATDLAASAATTGPAASAATTGPTDASAPDSAVLLETDTGTLSVTPIQHATFYARWGETRIVVDPVAGAFEAAGAPAQRADLVLVTDIHGDHLDPAQVEATRGAGAPVVAPAAAAEQLEGATVLANGASLRVLEGAPGGAFTITAVPMYNLTRTRPDSDEPFHPMGRGNGYLITRGETTLYVSGDTECTPQMKALEGVDVALLCMNLPYTMTPAEAATCARAFAPRLVLPFHHRGQDPGAFAAALADVEGVEVRILDWYPATDDVTGAAP